MTAAPRASSGRQIYLPPRRYRFRRRLPETRGTSQHMNFAVRKRRAPLIIIVSLVDILIILLIFFVVSTSFKKDQPEVQINLPESKTAQKRPAELDRAIVSVDENDQVQLDGKSVGVEIGRAS